MNGFSNTFAFPFEVRLDQSNGIIFATLSHNCEYHTIVVLHIQATDSAVFLLHKYLNYNCISVVIYEMRFF